jgi:CRP/FNR family nitrogen fixation transcriptional regulator
MRTSAMQVSGKYGEAPRSTPTRTPEPDSLRLIGITVNLSRDQEVYGEGGPAAQAYKVVSGAVRVFRVLSDGRRQICSFYLPGDVFGIEPGLEHRSTAEALTDTVLVVARRSALGDEGDAAAARRLWTLAMNELQRSQDHALTLGRRSACERVASFLVDVAERLGSGESLELPMSRQDIADYLGLTTETVSRTLTQLQLSGLISMTGCRSIQLRKARALAELCV